ncbi:MAG: hypothetical protein LBC09_05695 [Helicobacteraceae bacterium]|jgi:hypothetical protein|nr:hypothetical protein [Helicobacteraceae bacterium]
MGKRKIAEKVEIYLKIVKTMALVLALFGGGFAGLVKYYDFIEKTLGASVSFALLLIVVASIGVLSAIIISVFWIAITLNGKEKE